MDQVAPVSFNRFIEMMNQDAAKDLVRRINTFMRDFKSRPPSADDDSQAVQMFLQEMETAMAKHPLWVGSSVQELDAATEGLEKYLMTKLYERTFSAAPEDAERDALLAARLAALRFLRPEHLEIPPAVLDEACLAQAVRELNRIDGYKAPRDKLVCVLNCCRVINNLLTLRTQSDGIGADDFTPLLIYAVVRAEPARLASNLAYIERYRMASKLASETQYYYVQLCSAASFIEAINASSLKVNADEFIAHMMQHGALTDEQLALMGSSSAGGGGGGGEGSGGEAAAATPPQAAAGSAPSPSAASAVAAAPRQASKTAGVPPLHMQALPGLVTPLAPQQQQPHQQQQQQQQQEPHQQQPDQQQQQLQQQQLQQQQLQQQQLQQQQAATPAPQPPPQARHPASFLPPLSVADLEAQGAALLARTGGQQRLAGRHPFAFASLQSLTVGDVRRLLEAHKELVLRYEVLAAAVEWHHARAAQGLAPPAPDAAGVVDVHDGAAVEVAAAPPRPAAQQSDAGAEGDGAGDGAGRAAPPGSVSAPASLSVPVAPPAPAEAPPAVASASAPALSAAPRAAAPPPVAPSEPSPPAAATPTASPAPATADLLGSAAGSDADQPPAAASPSDQGTASLLEAGGVAGGGGPPAAAGSRAAAVDAGVDLMLAALLGSSPPAGEQALAQPAVTAAAACDGGATGEAAGDAWAGLDELVSPAGSGGGGAGAAPSGSVPAPGTAPTATASLLD